MGGLAWKLSILCSLWWNRLHYAVAAPFLFRNWWDVFLVKLRSEPVVLDVRNGIKYIVRPKTTDLVVINEAVCLNPYLKPGHIQLHARSTVVDVGANIGDFTIQVAKLCPEGHVYAVEPMADNCACIRRQVELNQTRNVTVLQLALGDRDGEIAIHNAGSQSSAYWGSQESERVRVCKMESLMRENGIETIDLLKMDCEGAEWDILPASTDLLPKIRQICLEYHNGKLTVDWLVPWLKRNGFSVEHTVGPWNGMVWAWREPR